MTDFSNRPTIYLTLADQTAWLDLAVAAWGLNEDEQPAIARHVSVDGPWRTIKTDAVFDGDGNLVSPAVLDDTMAVNLIAPPDYEWPEEITVVARPKPSNPQRVFPV